jgi:hypothetical protein
LLKVQLQRVGTFNEEVMMRASRMVALTITLMLACVGPVVGAVPTLVKFLDFRRPLDETEKCGAYPHLRGVWDMYPAVDALESMGVNALPALLVLCYINK